MALPSNDKIIGDLGHTNDHNAIVDEIIFIKENYLSASGSSLDDYLRKDTASSLYLPISASASISLDGYLTASAAEIIYAPINSPNLVGIPTAPTASAGNVTTQLATTEFVSIAVLAAQSGSVDLSAYLTKSSASSTYLTIVNAENTYLPISASSNFISASVNWSNINNKPDPTISIELLGNTTGSGSVTLTDLNNGQISIQTSTLHANTASSINWSGITGTPTTLLGYGITDALPASASSNYLLASTASATYLRRDTASATYLPISATATFGTGGGPYAMYTTSVTVSGLNKAANDSIGIFTNVNFPSGRFSVTPHVVATNWDDGNGAGGYKVIYTPGAINASSCSIYYANANLTTTLNKAAAVIMAIQMTEGSATG